MKAKLDLRALISTWARLLWVHMFCKHQYYVKWPGIFCDSLSGDVMLMVGLITLKVFSKWFYDSIIKILRNWEVPIADNAEQVSTTYFHTRTDKHLASLMGQQQGRQQHRTGQESKSLWLLDRFSTFIAAKPCLKASNCVSQYRTGDLQLNSHSFGKMSFMSP